MAYTNGQIRAAILRAAHQIETSPESYDFMTNRAPSCNTPGCMMGWIGTFLGFNPPDKGTLLSYVSRLELELPFSYTDIIDCWKAFCDQTPASTIYMRFGSRIPTDDADVAAWVMRRFADERYPSIVPLKVRELFDPKRARV